MARVGTPNSLQRHFYPKREFLQRHVQRCERQQYRYLWRHYDCHPPSCDERANRHHRAATNVTASAATLNATVNPKGLATTVSFQWGTTTAYGNTTASQAIGSGTAASGVAAPSSALAPNTIYHFRVVATNSAGTTNGADVAFTTSTSSTFAITVTKAGIGSGTVTSWPAGINCGATCSASFANGTTVDPSPSPPPPTPALPSPVRRLLRHRPLHPHHERRPIGGGHLRV